MMDIVHVYQGKDEQWYWHRKSENGKVVSDGGGFNKWGNAYDSAEDQFGEDVEYIVHHRDAGDPYPGDESS